MSPGLATLAVEWMELQAMRQGRPRDDGREAFYHAEIEASRALEADSRPLDALRRYQAIARDFTGLRDTSEPAREAKRLEASAATATQIAEERRWEKYEERWSGSLSRVVGELVNLDPPPRPRACSPTSRLQLALAAEEDRRRRLGDCSRAPHDHGLLPHPEVARRATASGDTGLEVAVPSGRRTPPGTTSHASALAPQTRRPSKALPQR
jgi:hypothetical protein